MSGFSTRPRKAASHCALTAPSTTYARTYVSTYVRPTSTRRATERSQAPVSTEKYPTCITPGNVLLTWAWRCGHWHPRQKPTSKNTPHLIFDRQGVAASHPPRKPTRSAGEREQALASEKKPAGARAFCWHCGIHIMYVAPNCPPGIEMRDKTELHKRDKSRVRSTWIQAMYHIPLW